MRILPAVLFVTLALALGSALSGCQFCADSTPWPRLANEPLGARCGGDADCAAGLTCLDRTCTVGCQGAPGSCPAGSACFYDHHCLPTCDGEAACLLGHTVGACAQPPPPDASYCYQRGCRSDAECPQGWCAGYSAARGITWNQDCTMGTCMWNPPP